MPEPVLTERERLILVAYYTAEISGGKAAEWLGLHGKAELIDWLEARDMVFLLYVDPGELLALRTELWAEGTPPEQIESLLGGNLPPAVQAVLRSVSRSELEAFLREQGIDPNNAQERINDARTP